MNQRARFTRKLRNRMLLQILSAACVVLLLLGVTLFWVAHTLLLGQVAKGLGSEIDVSTGRMETWLVSRAQVAWMMATTLSSLSMDDDEVLAYLGTVSRRYGIKEGFIGFEDGRYLDPAWQATEDYDPRERSWYQQCKTLQAPGISAPYLDADTGDMIVSLTAPILRQGVFAGVLGVDVFPGEILATLTRVGGYRGGAVYVLDGQGRFIVHPDKASILNVSVHETAMAEIYRTYRDDASIRGRLLDWRGSYVCFSPIPSAGWTMLYQVDKGDVRRPLYRLAIFFGAGALFALVVLALAVAMVSRILSQPILDLADAAGDIAEGDYDRQVDESRRDELGYLSFSFNLMARGLKEREEIQRQLDVSKAARARMEGELQAGHDIQVAMLPRQVGGGSARYDAHGGYSPAKEVAGDFYDVFDLPDGRVAFAVGDVSGKGVPAALFMATACTCFRVICPLCGDPAEAMRQVNDRLAIHNDRCMFVTVFLAYYDPATGAVTFANGGHNPPLVRRADGHVCYLPKTEGCLLGPMADRSFACGTLTLSPGDTVLLYTDGIPEAHPEGGEMFGEARLEQMVRTWNGADLREFCDDLVRQVRDHQGREQFDDITLLAWRRTR